MSGTEVLYEVDGGVARVTINRPERRNAMSFGVMQGLRDAMRARARRRRRARRRAHRRGRQGVLRGRRPRRHRRERRARPRRTTGAGCSPICSATMWALGKPTIARVRGYALAGGFGLALRVRPRRRGRRRGVRHARDQRRPVAVHDHGAAAALDAAEDGARADDDRPAGRRRRRPSASASCTRVVPVAELDAAVDELAADARGEVAARSCAGAATRSTACSRWTPTPRSRTSRRC